MSISRLESIITLLDTSFTDDISHLWSWNEIIKEGYDIEIDAYRKTLSDVKDWLSEYQKQISEETGIHNLRIKFTSQAWYFIEVSKNQVHKVPESFVHTQTLVNASRFITPELNTFQQKLFEAEDFISQRENQIFLQILDTLLLDFDFIKKVSYSVGDLDYLSWLSRVAYGANFVKPSMHTASSLEIHAGRHPIIESISNDFISNSLVLTPQDYIHIITWPNMWWKSTYLRQNAIIILLAHIWSFVPAKTAHIPITDKIFSRVWAYDNLYFWQSTFMVEMQEMSNILHNATDKSFVIIDEIGRGTSTYDGMSLAWAILVYLHNYSKVKTLFATHYHEITDLSQELPWVSNYSVAVWENNDNIIFLRKIISGAMKQSYGIEVAKIAGLPSWVLRTAREFLSQISSWQKEYSYQLQLWDIHSVDNKNTEDVKYSEIWQSIVDLDIDTLTPLQALSLLSELQSKMKKK